SEGDSAGATSFGEPDAETSLCGHLLTRDHTVATPASATLPALTALLQVSRGISQVRLGEGVPEVDGSWPVAARQGAAYQLRCAAARVQVTGAVLDRLRRAETVLGVEVLDESMRAEEGAQIGTVLVPGARICFTGTALDSDGREVPRERMEQMAADAGLAPVRSVTKARCEVLVTAEEGTQSGKARKAVDLGKPVFSAEQFFGWVASR
ncbi:MAG: recD2, partial [Mycobacterium sp.]|nr:recD2 [Mycobacterium sp.]